jgi:hypothetical protein
MKIHEETISRIIITVRPTEKEEDATEYCLKNGYNIVARKYSYASPDGKLVTVYVEAEKPYEI